MLAKLIASMVGCTGLVVACGHRTPGADPHDMSAAQHDAMARQERAEAELHAARSDAGARGDEMPCPAGSFSDPSACWISTRQRKGEHLERAEQHRRRAADHRAASQALRGAEARACVGISEQDRDESPFSHREEIASVEELRSPPSPKATIPRVEGAVIAFRAVPGMTAQWLQRVVNCHLARNAALGHDVPEMAYCPLVPRGVSASVTPTQTGFAVAIKAEDPDVALEVVRRARALAPR